MEDFKPVNSRLSNLLLFNGSAISCSSVIFLCLFIRYHPLSKSAALTVECKLEPSLSSLMFSATLW